MVAIDRLLDWIARRHVRACLLLLAIGLAMALPGFSSLFPMDRDEPRFAQASKQMLETGDFVDIRFQDEARNKKPVGIYWMQAGTVALGEALGVIDARTAIWLYRIPSLMGALAAILFTYWAALPLVPRRGAVLAGALLGSTVLLAVEAHLAKTDAMLLATVVAVMGVLARAWMARAQNRRLSLGLCALFWTALAVGILVKGPITPMVPFFAVLVLSARHRSIRWLSALRPGVGALWCGLIVLPWLVLILWRTGGTFLADSLGHDMLGKVAGAQESHGAPFGTYLAAFWVTGWPLAPFVLLSAVFAWKNRWSDTVSFLLAWANPTWLLFELVPTKLPHYVLPTYPALAILAAAAMTQPGRMMVGRARLVVFGIAAMLLPALLPVVLAMAKGRLASNLDGGTIALAALAFVVATACVVLAIRCVRTGAIEAASGMAVVASLAVHAFVLGHFMNAGHADLIGLSPRLAAAGHEALGLDCASTAAYATVGDREPSLVFLTDTALLMTDGPGAAAFMAQGSCRVAFVRAPDEAAFKASLGPTSAATLASRVNGVNINGGKSLDIGVYVRRLDPP